MVVVNGYPRTMADDLISGFESRLDEFVDCNDLGKLRVFAERFRRDHEERIRIHEAEIARHQRWIEHHREKSLIWAAQVQAIDEEDVTRRALAP